MSLIHQSLECPSKLWFLLSIRRLLTGFTNIKEYRHFPVAIPRYLGALSFSDLHFPPIPREKKEPYFEFLRIYATSFLGWEVWPHSHHTDPPKSSRTHGRHLNFLGLTYSPCGAPPLPGAHLSPPYVLEGQVLSPRSTAFCSETSHSFKATWQHTLSSIMSRQDIYIFNPPAWH